MDDDDSIIITTTTIHYGTRNYHHHHCIPYYGISFDSLFYYDHVDDNIDIFKMYYYIVTISSNHYISFDFFFVIQANIYLSKRTLYVTPFFDIVVFGSFPFINKKIIQKNTF